MGDFPATASYILSPLILPSRVSPTTCHPIQIYSPIIQPKNTKPCAQLYHVRLCFIGWKGGHIGPLASLASKPAPARGLHNLCPPTMSSLKVQARALASWLHPSPLATIQQGPLPGLANCAVDNKGFFSISKSWEFESILLKKLLLNIRLLTSPSMVPSDAGQGYQSLPRPKMAKGHTGASLPSQGPGVTMVWDQCGWHPMLDGYIHIIEREIYTHANIHRVSLHAKIVSTKSNQLVGQFLVAFDF